jgi:hypothetical protein
MSWAISIPLYSPIFSEFLFARSDDSMAILRKKCAGMRPVTTPTIGPTAAHILRKSSVFDILCIVVLKISATRAIKATATMTADQSLFLCIANPRLILCPTRRQKRSDLDRHCLAPLFAQITPVVTKSPTRLKSLPSSGILSSQPQLWSRSSRGQHAPRRPPHLGRSAPRSVLRPKPAGEPRTIAGKSGHRTFGEPAGSSTYSLPTSGEGNRRRGVRVSPALSAGLVGDQALCLVEGTLRVLWHRPPAVPHSQQRRWVAGSLELHR